jgi:hypothetical protein
MPLHVGVAAITNHCFVYAERAFFATAHIFETCDPMPSIGDTVTVKCGALVPIERIEERAPERDICAQCLTAIGAH